MDIKVVPSRALIDGRRLGTGSVCQITRRVLCYELSRSLLQGIPQLYVFLLQFKGGVPVYLGQRLWNSNEQHCLLKKNWVDQKHDMLWTKKSIWGESYRWEVTAAAKHVNGNFLKGCFLKHNYLKRRHATLRFKSPKQGGLKYIMLKPKNSTLKSLDTVGKLSTTSILTCVSQQRIK